MRPAYNIQKLLNIGDAVFGGAILNWDKHILIKLHESDNCFEGFWKTTDDLYFAVHWDIESL